MGMRMCPKPADGEVVTILDEALHRLGDGHALVDKATRLVLPNPGAILVWIVPAGQLAPALCKNVHLFLPV